MIIRTRKEVVTIVLDFSSIDLRDEALLILRRADGSPIAPMGHAQQIVCDPMYNEVSTLAFEVPAYVNGKAVPYFDQLVGMNIVEYRGVGQFLLINPIQHDDGIKCYKECKAYSLEYEFTYKKFYLARGTYNFWNPVAPNGTILGMILEMMPSWGPGTIDASLVGVYRTFELNGSENIYNVIKSQLQKTFNCIFTFDTYNRTVSVRDVSSHIRTDEVYLSLDNLIKDVEIEENTENIITCLDVYGADGVDIRAVNPMGINKIYNLDYWMTPTYFSDEMIDSYQRWKAAFQDAQMPYYNLTINKMLQTARLLAEQAQLTELNGELKSKENLQAVYIEAISENLTPAEDFANKLATVRTEIAGVHGRITQQEALIKGIESEIERMTAEQVEINTRTALGAFFDVEQLKILNHYIKEDAINESSFVAPTAKNYNTEDQNWVLSGTGVSLRSRVTSVQTDDGELFTARGGAISFGDFDGEIISATYERKTADGSFLLTAYLAKGEVTDGGTNTVTEYKNACLSISGKAGAITTAAAPEGSVYPDEVTFTITEATAYFTVNLTEYDRFAVCWELFEYGMECLEKFAYPTYTFKIEAANFLSLEEYQRFRNGLTLGDRVYVDTDRGVLQPVLIGAHIEHENPEAFTLTFNDTFSALDPAFGLAELLEQSVSMGHTLDSDRYSYAAFVASGADTHVKEYMDQAIDLARKDILSTTGQQITMGSEGLRLRKLKETGETYPELDTVARESAYSPKQTWIVNNKILFTDDNWQTVKGLVGEFEDPNMGSMYGLMMPYISGTIMAGNNLIIESAKKDGGVSVFRVDGDGARLHNATFDIYNEDASTQITLNPDIGIAIGSSGLYSVNPETGERTLNADRAKFWADDDGNLHLKGIIEATGGSFSGELKAATGTFTGTLSAATGTFSGELSGATGSFKGRLDVGTTSALHVDANGRLYIGSSAYNSAPFRVDQYGNLTATSATISGTITASDIDVNPTTATRLNQLLSGYTGFYGGHITDLNASNIKTGTLSADLIEAISVSADDITAGTLNAGSITLSDSYGGFKRGTGASTGSNGETLTTEGAMVYGGRTSINYLIATTMGVRMQAGSAYFGIYDTGYSTNIPGLGTSDRRLKHDIHILDDVKDPLQQVYMSLRPSTFVMNNSKDQKKSFGFIAQEVEDAFISAGLDPGDYYVVRAPISDDLSVDNYMLYYNEFTAWNTYMIQKLYARVEELEKRLQGE